jgi:endonuclease/exonuclease/phosphatase family metal-dependent hydrolase
MAGMAGLCVIVAVALFICAGCAAPAHSSDSLRVMSFNIRCATATGDGENIWPNRREMFFATIRAFDPDLLGSQEAVGTQPQEMRDAMPEYAFVGVGRDDGSEAGEMSPILFRKARFENLASGSFWLSETPRIPGSKSWDAAITRIATWVRLRDRRSDGRAVLVINTHWDHVGQIARLRSAELIRAKLRELAGGSTVIVMGDLNCTEDDAPLSALVGTPASSPRLIDSYRSTHPDRSPDEATFHAFKGTAQGDRIDFILHTPDLRAAQAGIDRTNREGRYPSDHFAVTAVLKYAPRGTGL